MEENALLSNIATIITKDILIDECNNLRKPKQLSNSDENGKYPLLESDDEAFMFFLNQQQREAKQRPSASGATAEAFTNSFTAAKYRKMLPKRSGRQRTSVNMPVPASGIRQKNIELNLLNNFQPAEFEGFLHMTKMTFLRMFQSMRHLLLHPATKISVPPQTIFSLALWKLSTDEHFEQIARKFRIPFNDCCQITRHFWNVISENYESFIKWPNSKLAQQATLHGFFLNPQLKVLPGIFGIIVIKRLDIFLETEEEEISVVLQIICNAEQKVIDCFVELTQDYSFEASPIGQTLALNAQTIPGESYLVGNKCFPLKSYLMRPFEIEVFQKEVIFNRMLESALITAQCVLDTMAKRFNILYALEAKNLGEVRRIVETVCSLHNLCSEIYDDYIDKNAETIKFNWANTNGNINVKGSEQDQQGLKRRFDLMEKIVEQQQSKG